MARMAGTGYDVQRLTPGGVVTEHYDGAIETDGPWLVMHDGVVSEQPAALFPAHAVVSVKPCTGTCGTDG